MPWEQNLYFIPALEAVGVTAVGADASKPYPDPPDDQFGIGTSYSGPEYPAGTSFVDGTTQVVPRQPVNIYYNASTEAQEVDEYNTIYLSVNDGGSCVNTSVTTCETAPATFADIVDGVVSGMLQNMLSNNPEPTYVHQTNIMGTPPAGSPTAPPPDTPDTTGDGLLYSVLNPLLTEYNEYFSALSPYVQLTEGGIGTVLNEQSTWANALSAGTVDASEDNGVVTVTNHGSSAIKVPMSMPVGSSVDSVSVGPQYGATDSGWETVAPGSSVMVNTVGSAPSITSSPSATAQTGSAFTDTVTTSGTPEPALSESGTLPTGVTFTDNGDGTATLAGTPDAGTGGVYPLTLTADNQVGSPATQVLTLTVDEAPSITSSPSATAQVGSPFTDTVSTSGYPTAALSESGTLPTGVTFTDNHDGTATLAGTPAAGTSGVYSLTLTADNGVGSPATQTFTLTVGSGPAFTGADATTFTVGQAGTFTVTTAGLSGPSLSESGTLPSGVTFTDNHDGTATLAGTPAAGTGGVYSLTLTANGGGGPISEGFTLTVDDVPAITSSPSATARTGSSFTDTVSTSGFPAPALSESGALPTGVTFTDNHDGTATLAGTPAAGTGGVYSLTLTADNGVGSPATQTFTLTVDQAPAITSAASTSFTVGHAASFTVTTSGFPVPALGESGALPTGITFHGNGDGTATISGTPTESGQFTLQLEATNTVGSASQTLSITVDGPPTVIVPGSKVTRVGKKLKVIVRTTGFPRPTITESRALPKGVKFVDNGSGKGTLSGHPAAGSEGTYPLAFTATNSFGHATGLMVLTVKR